MSIGKTTRVRIVSATLAAAAIAAAVATAVVARAKRAPRPPALNVVVVLADTLRADHLSLYGYARRTSPRLDHLARRRGVVFENARAQAPCTFPSVNSMLTSRSPLRFVGAAPQVLSIPKELPTLATILAAAGYATAAVSASPVVRATPSSENPHGGFGAGFDTFDESCYWADARCVTRAATRALSRLREPFLLYVHYLDPHDPYRPPDGFARRFAGEPQSEKGREFVVGGDPTPVAARIRESLDPGLGDDELAYFIGLYDDEILFWDRQAARLIDELEHRKLPGRTVVAIVSDHGESFLEHGQIKHCRSLFDTEIRVPMVLLAPDAAPRRVAAPVANLDLVPTLLDLAGISEVPPELEGRSLRGLLEGRSGTAAPAFFQRSWWGSRRAVADGRFKLVGVAESPPAATPRSLQLFDLETDPGETTDVAAAQRAAFARLRAEMSDWMRLEPTPGPAAADEVEKQLRSLGYLQ